MQLTAAFVGEHFIDEELRFIQPPLAPFPPVV